ncbi:MAG TPA: hypothetical protein PLX65_03875, partial [Accumulibacter sp.]|nr:hypothetical protein [Accumulibacter sp.]
MNRVKHFLQFSDFGRDEYDHLFARAAWIKAQFKSHRQYWPLIDRTLVMIFEKASTRTRLSFEAGAENALNTLDSRTVLTVNGKGQNLPAANVHVEENRS